MQVVLPLLDCSRALALAAMGLLSKKDAEPDWPKGSEEEIFNKIQDFMDGNGYIPIEAHFAVLGLKTSPIPTQDEIDRAFRKKYDKAQKKDHADGGERAFRRLTVAHLNVCKHAYETIGERESGVHPDPVDRLKTPEGKLKTAVRTSMSAGRLRFGLFGSRSKSPVPAPSAAPAPAPASSKRPTTPEAPVPPPPGASSRFKAATRASMAMFKGKKPSPTPEEMPGLAPGRQPPSLRSSLKMAAAFGSKGAAAPAPAEEEPRGGAQPFFKLQAAARASASSLSLFGSAKETAEKRRKDKEEKGPTDVDEARSFLKRRNTERKLAKERREKEEAERYANSRLGRLEAEEKERQRRQAPAGAPPDEGDVSTLGEG